MRVRERREMNVKVKSGFQVQALSGVYASVLYENSLIYGVCGGKVLVMSDEGKATDRRIGDG